jgi:hypothetical protein
LDIARQIKICSCRTNTPQDPEYESVFSAPCASFHVSGFTEELELKQLRRPSIDCATSWTYRQTLDLIIAHLFKVLKLKKACISACRTFLFVPFVHFFNGDVWQLISGNLVGKGVE